MIRSESILAGHEEVCVYLLDKYLHKLSISFDCCRNNIAERHIYEINNLFMDYTGRSSLIRAQKLIIYVCVFYAMHYKGRHIYTNTERHAPGEINRGIYTN